MIPKVVTPAQVVRSSLVSFVFLFALPSFAVWFAGYGVRSMDEDFLERVLPAIRADSSIPAEELSGTIAFFREAVPSRVCGSTEPAYAVLRQRLGDGCGDYTQFRFMRRAAWAVNGLGLLAVLVAIAAAIAARGSRSLQYTSFVASFQTLRVLSALIVVLQAGIAVFLSFWVTAIFTERYFLKLVLFVGIAACTAVYAILKSIFARLPTDIPVPGMWIPWEKAPALRERLEVICKELGTEPPAHLVAGIDDNFFVCQGDIVCEDANLKGRVLYVSLCLLRILSRGEADAILVHEMAHFSGGDVEHSSKLAPALVRCDHFIDTLAVNLLSIPVAKFLLAYRSLLQLSFGRERRERELAADANAARLTSPDHLARSLVRVSAYSSFARRVESSLFDQNTAHESLGIADRIERGFGEYASSPKLAFDLVETRVPHPFDSHPPLLERVAHVGSALKQDDFSAVLAEAPTESYVDTIEGAEAIETRLWSKFEGMFQTTHELVLAHRYAPSTPEERAVVERHFPRTTFESRTSYPYVTVDFAELKASDWENPLAWKDIDRADVTTSMMKDVLVLKVKGDGMFAGQKIRLDDLMNREHFLQEFNAYWNRAREAVKYAEDHPA